MARKVDPKKEEADRLQKILLELLKEEENKYCADCQAKTPRWASYNLGVFICIRCAGIHRNLGVHISKVRSVTLDSWTVDQVKQVQQMGNERARAIYENTLPDGFRRPTSSDHQMEQFIRAKYEQKRYMSKDANYVPPAPRERRIAVSANGTSVIKQTTPQKPVEQPSLLDFDSPTPSVSHSSTVPSLIDDFGGLSVAGGVTNSGPAHSDDDPFGEFVSASNGSAVTSSITTASFANFDAVDTNGSSSNNGQFATFDVAPSIAAPPSSSTTFDPFGAPSSAPAPPVAPSGGGGDLFGLDVSVPSVGTVPSSGISPGMTQSSISPIVATGTKSNADILALFGPCSTQTPSTFSGLPTGGFPATAYGLSQFSTPAPTVPAAQAQMGGAFGGMQMGNGGGVGMMPAMGMQPQMQQPFNGLSGLLMGGAPAPMGMAPGAMPVQQATPTSPGPAPMQTRAMKAFDGIDKSMFVSAATSKPSSNFPKAPPPSNNTSQFQAPPPAQATPISTADDLFGLF